MLPSLFSGLLLPGTRVRVPPNTNNSATIGADYRTESHRSGTVTPISRRVFHSPSLPVDPQSSPAPFPERQGALAVPTSGTKGNEHLTFGGAANKSVHADIERQTPAARTVSSKSNQTKKKQDCQSGAYDDDTVRVLLRCMAESGYNDPSKLTRTRRELFNKVVSLAETKYGIARTADGWERKFDRLKKSYGTYVALLSKSGRDGAEEDLYHKPPFCTELHELEKSNARHRPPTTLSTDSPLNTTAIGGIPTSTRKRARQDTRATIVEIQKIAAERQSALHEQLVIGNQEKKRFNDLFARFIEKMG